MGVGFSTNADATFTTGDVLSNDIDLDGDSLTVTSYDDSGTVGVVQFNIEGTFNYDPDGQYESLAPGEQAIDTFTYTVSDGHGGGDTATVTITVTGVQNVFLTLVIR